jgi:uncharacterized protein YndB with AHSA1/START domain
MAEVSVSTRISAPADEVWRLVGGWNALPDWHPAVEKSEVEQGSNLRHVRLADGTEITEQLENIDADERTYTYSITSSPLPVTNYRSTITVRSEGNTSTVEWSTNFEPLGVPEADVVRSLSDFYRAGLENLKKLLSGSRATE